VEIFYREISLTGIGIIDNIESDFEL
jgi:hypothetical protein